MIPPIKIMEQIVARVSDIITPVIQANDKQVTGSTKTNIKAVNYLCGHWIEIINKLDDMSKNPKTAPYKFPLVALLEDIPISTGEVTMQIFICHYTNKNYDTLQRQAINYDPILYPIRDELFKQINLSSYFMEKGINYYTFPGTIFDRKYFGREEIYGNKGFITNEYVDAIQLQDFKLTLTKKTC